MSRRESQWIGIDYPPPTAGTVIVWGYLASYPFGGMTWQALHYIASLRRCGVDVWYVEDTDAEVRDPQTHWGNDNYLPNVAFLKRYMAMVGLSDRWIFRPPGREKYCLGAKDHAGLMKLYAMSDAVINLCGSHELRSEHDNISHLVYLETDPVPRQIAVADADAATIAELDRYSTLFSYGENLGAADCAVPIRRYQWHATRPPVVMEWWAPQLTSAPKCSAFTTVSNWSFSGNDLVFQGQQWRWSKHHEFRNFKNLPARVDVPLEIAIAGLGGSEQSNTISEQEARQFEAAGWRLRSTMDLTDPLDYRDYIRSSLGEFTVAKEQYVKSWSGWFSDRSVCYLASGRPVVTQETGFSKFVPCGEGLFSFSTVDEAAQSLDIICSSPEKQSRAALEIADEYFDGVKLARRVLETIGIL